MDIQWYNLVIWYFVSINVIAFIVYGADKLCAMRQWWRVPEFTLLGLAFMGGSIGALIAMYVFHHKTKQDYFAVGVPLIILMQIVVLFFLMNGKI